MKKRDAESFKVFSSIDTISDIVDKHIQAYYGRTAIRYDAGDGYESFKFEDYHFYIKAFIQFLNVQDMQQEVLATFCKNRLEWDMVAMGAFYTANILFPIDTKTNSLELKHLLSANAPAFILVSKQQLARFRSLKEELGLSTRIILADLARSFEDIGAPDPALDGDELSMKDVVGAYLPDKGIHKSGLLVRDDTILGHYPTSGTTSLPKIVCVSHGNIVSEVNEAVDVLNLRPKEEILNIGPYTHIATLVEFLVTKTRGFTVTYFTREPDEEDVLEGEIRKLKKQGVRIKALMAVPKFWIYIVKEVLEEMKNKPVLEGLYKHLMRIEQCGDFYDIGALDKAKLCAMRTLLRNKLGGYFSYGVSSSTKLDGAIVEIFGKLGITVMDIYGATECSGIISRNKLNDVTPGSCGRIITILDYRLVGKHKVPGIEHEVGLLEVKGKTVAHSYLGGEELKLTDDGYFNTGDLCYVSEDRLVYIIGRKKELLAWDDGSYVDPQRMSNLLVRNIFVKDALATRANPEDDFLSVYIYPDYQRIRNDIHWKKEMDTGLSESYAVKTRLVHAIEYANSISGISAKLSTKHIYLLPRELERTPTHKIKFIFENQRLHLAKRL